MDLVGIWDALGLNVEIDWDTKTFSLKLGPLTVRKVPFLRTPTLVSDKATIEIILTKHFAQRGVMWADFERETVSACIRSMRELQMMNEDAATKFDSTKRSKDQVYATGLRSWATACDRASRLLTDALEASKNPVASDDAPPEAYIPDALRDMRLVGYGVIAALAELLPDSNQVKQNVVHQARHGVELMTRPVSGEPSVSDLNFPAIFRPLRGHPVHARR